MLEELNEKCGNSSILQDLLSKGLKTRSAWETGVQQKDVGFGMKQDKRASSSLALVDALSLEAFLVRLEGL